MHARKSRWLLSIIHQMLFMQNNGTYCYWLWILLKHQIKTFIIKTNRCRMVLRRSKRQTKYDLLKNARQQWVFRDGVRIKIIILRNTKRTIPIFWKHQQLPRQQCFLIKSKRRWYSFKWLEKKPTTRTRRTSKMLYQIPQLWRWKFNMLVV